METELSILLIEDDITACDEINKCIKHSEHLSLSAITDNSYRALEMVQVHQPNVILLDLELHHGCGNGITFLAELRNLHLKKQPFILVTTQNMSPATLTQARQLGADFTLTKYEDNYSAEYVIHTLELMRPAILYKNNMANTTYETSHDEELELISKQIQFELACIGIKTNSVGFKYLTDSILLVIDEPTSNLPKQLAPKYKKTAASIERAMQNAIKSTWERTSIDSLYTHYTAYVDPEKGYPTTTQFVYYYAEKIKRDFKIKK